MEFQKIISLLDTTFNGKDLPKFVIKKWIEVYDQSEKNYSVNKEISGAYIVVKGTITVTYPNNAKGNKSVAFKNNAPFVNWISKINGVQIDNAEDLYSTVQ